MTNNRIEFTQEEQELFEQVLEARRVYANRYGKTPPISYDVALENLENSYDNFMNVFMKSFDGLDI